MLICGPSGVGISMSLGLGVTVVLKLVGWRPTRLKLVGWRPQSSRLKGDSTCPGTFFWRLRNIAWSNPVFHLLHKCSFRNIALYRVVFSPKFDMSWRNSNCFTVQCPVPGTNPLFHSDFRLPYSVLLMGRYLINSGGCVPQWIINLQESPTVNK